MSFSLQAPLHRWSSLLHLQAHQDVRPDPLQTISTCPKTPYDVRCAHHHPNLVDNHERHLVHPQLRPGIEALHCEQEAGQ